MSNAHHVDRATRKRKSSRSSNHTQTADTPHEPIDCRYCDGKTFLAAAIPPLGFDPGALVFQCRGCGTVNWVKLPPAARASAH